MSIRRCETCTKRSKYGGCAVLKVQIGHKADCWAWSDDPHWGAKHVVLVRAYEEGCRGGPLPDRWAGEYAAAKMGMDIETLLGGKK
jgi:hypothetical protein